MRLIDADVIQYQLLKPNTNPTLWCVSKDAVDLIPTVDAVHVVRCRDCKHRMIASSEEGTHYHYCAKNDHAIDIDDYCSRGEKVTE